MKKYWIWTILITAVLCAAGWMYWRAKSPTADGVVYKPFRVRRGDIEMTVRATGGVEPQNRVEIKPPIGGRIEDMRVREGDVVRKGDIVAWMSSTERAALLDAARIKGPEEVARWAQMYKPAPLVAPIDGMIIARKVEPGQSVTSADAVLVMSDRLIVKAQVDETDIGSVKVRQEATIVLDAYPQQSIDGIVDHIAYEAETVNNVTIYSVDVLPDEIPAFMRSGMTANVTFVIDRREDALWVPAEAVHETNGEKWVMRADSAGSPESDREKPHVPVETGLSDGKRTEILSGLAEGDKILVGGLRMPDSRSPAPSNPFSPFGQRRPRS